MSHTELMNCVTNKGNLDQVQLTYDLRCELWNSNPDLIVRSDNLHLIFLWLIQWCTHMQANEMYVRNSWYETLSQSLNWNICNGAGYIVHHLYEWVFIRFSLNYMCILHFLYMNEQQMRRKVLFSSYHTCQCNVTVFFHRRWNLKMFQRKMVISTQWCFFLNNRPVDCIFCTFNLIWDGWCNVFACSISIHIFIVTMVLKCFLSSTQFIDRVKKNVFPTNFEQRELPQKPVALVFFPFDICIKQII